MRRTRRAGLCIALLTVLCTASVTAATCFATSKRISASATSVCSLADHPLVRRLSWLRLRGGGSASGDGDAAIWSGKSKQYDARNRGAKGEKRAKSEKSEERIENAMDAVSTKSKKKKRRSGIDWETFRRKVPGGAPVDDSPYDPYFEGHDGKVYKMMTHDGKHIRAVPANPPKRGKWRQKEVVKRRVEAILEAARKNRELDSPYVDGPAFGELGLQADGQPARRHSWERHLFPHLRAAIEAERAGLHFTGRFRFDERGRQMPEYTDKNYTIEPVSEARIPLPEGRERAPTIAEQEHKFSYTPKGVVIGDGAVAAGASGGRTGASAEELEEGERAVALIQADAAKQNQTLVEHVAALRSRSVRLSKAKRYLKHVQGHSTETLARMANGTLTTDSAWGPHKVIRGEGGGAEGAVWGTRAPAGRKRRDAAWYRERAVKGNDKAQLQLGLAYLEGAGVARNQSRGAGWLARSAKQGNLRAMHELAQCYRFGEGVLRHNASAVQLLKQAARKGHLQAQEDLGVAHMDGLLGLPRDAQAALTALRLAAQSGSRRAATRLGVLFAEGRDGVPPDERMAEMYLLRAARSYRTSHASGSSEVREGARALFKLARRFLEGRGVRQDIFKAVDWAARSAIKGYNPALLMLADCYAQGVGVARDERVALRCFRLAAVRGDTRGAVGLARGLLRAAEDTRDDKAFEARRWLQLSAGSGDSEAACLLAWCWANGTGGDQDATEARRFFLQAATADEPSAEAQYQLAIRTGVNTGGVPALAAAEEGSAAGAIQVFDVGAERLLRLAAEGGHSGALLTLGSFLVKSGDDRASEGAVWLRKAAEAGNIGGMLLLGRCLAAGCGVDADEEEGALWMARAREGGAEVDMEWVRGAAARGVLEAKRLLANEIMAVGTDDSGALVELPGGLRVVESAAELLRDLAKLKDSESLCRYGAWLAATGDDSERSCGLKMLEEAAEQGNPEAMCVLGMAHARGMWGLSPSATIAVYWYSQGAAAGLAEAQFRLGVLYEHGQGVGQDKFMAAEWYAEAAAQGHVDAAFAAGVAYSRGRGVPRDHAAAVYWYSRAAHAGHGRAQFNLALRYTDGAGVPKDPVVAARWFRAATSQGVLGHLPLLKKGVLQNYAKMELRQDMVDNPSVRDAKGGGRAVPTRVMKLSAYKAIQWKRNPASFRKSALTSAAHLRAEGKKIPRFVEIDDPKSPNFGKVYATRPEHERIGRALSKLLMTHGTDWDAMRFDMRNDMKWDAGMLRRKCVKLMQRRTTYPADYFDKREQAETPQMAKLLQAYEVKQAARRQRRTEAAAILAAGDGSNRLRLRSVGRLEILADARAKVESYLPGLDPAAALPTSGRAREIVQAISHVGLTGVTVETGLSTDDIIARLPYTDEWRGDGPEDFIPFHLLPAPSDGNGTLIKCEEGGGRNDTVAIIAAEEGAVVSAGSGAAGESPSVNARQLASMVLEGDESPEEICEALSKVGASTLACASQSVDGGRRTITIGGTTLFVPSFA